MTARHPAPVRFSRSPYLVELIAQAERLAARLAAASAPDTLRERSMDRAALATLRLDGSTIERAPDLTQAGLEGAGPIAPAEQRAGTWLDALRLPGSPFENGAEERVRTLEYVGARAALAADDLAGQLLAAPLETLAALHGRLVGRLVDDEHAGTLRHTDQAVHDASVGRVLFFPTEPAGIPSALALLASWLTSAAAREHPLVAAGVVHHELLRIHPFEAANGRLARAAARLVLRAGGLDPAGLAAPEPALAADPIGYYEEVARTLRRRDLTIWLERWGEAVTDGLRGSARELGLLARDAPARARTFLAGRDDPAFTVADYRAEAGVGPRQAAADLAALLDEGLVTRVPGARGLRFTVVAPAT